MGKDTLTDIIELEGKFQELAKAGHPNVMDNGFFLDAVFNVIAFLKEQHKLCEGSEGCNMEVYQSKVQVIENLYKSLKDFERLYTECLGTTK